MRHYFLLVFCLLSFSKISSSDEASKIPVKQQSWKFDGIFGKFDRQAAQRGFNVYKEVCSACHSMNHLSYRNLQEIGFSEDEVKSIASEYQVTDGPNDAGDMFQRAALPSDRFTPPYPNEKAARASNNGALPPDLSLIIKAREDGANYIFSILTGYKDAPADFKLMSGLYYNPYFSHMQIAMPPPLSDGQVSFDDGTPSSVAQMSKDVVVFLQWASEPEMENRKSMGIKVIIFLIIFTTFFYVAKKRIWEGVK
jgi:ubiquinol-cytochrome c reductase cytochrome c1 subunit